VFQAILLDVEQQARIVLRVRLEGIHPCPPAGGVAGEKTLMGPYVYHNITLSEANARNVIFACIPGLTEHVVGAYVALASNPGLPIYYRHDICWVAYDPLESNVEGILKKFNGPQAPY
jgi:hypothetical protein